MGTVTGEGGGHHLPVKQEADGRHVPEEEENKPDPKAKVGQLLLGLSRLLYLKKIQD